MPENVTLDELIIEELWTHDSQPDRIHYRAVYPDGAERRLWESRDSEWGKVLVAWLPSVRAEKD